MQNNRRRFRSGPSNEDEVQNASDELHIWLSDWTGQARAFITRGDYLIRLGLSTRKKPSRR
jgi:hypothetical protein